MNDTTTSIRDSLEDAVEQVESQQPEIHTPEPSPSEPEPSSSAATPPEAPEGEGPAGEQPERAERQRDESGKFARKDPMQPGPKSEPKQQREDRAPQSWKPETREHWAQLPPEVKAEVARREREFAVTMQETAEQRRFADAVTKTIAPYEHFIRAEGGNALLAIDSMMTTAARFRTGNAPEVANLVGYLVNQFGVGRFGNGFIEMLDQALVGQTPQVDPREQAMRAQIEQEIAPVRQFMNEITQAKQMQEMQLQQAAGGEVQGFLANHEFAMDVKEDMADLIELANKRGREMSLDEAYDRACRAHPEISKVFAKRDQANAAASRNQVAQRARAASVSVGGAPTPGPTSGNPADLRSALENAWSSRDR
jgi:hypothetical protein